MVRHSASILTGVHMRDYRKMYKATYYSRTNGVCRRRHLIVTLHQKDVSRLYSSQSRQLE